MHLLHECIAIRTQLQGAQRLTTFLVQHNTRTSPELGIGVALNVSERAVDEAIATITEWLHAQVVALHDPILTTELMTGTPPPQRQRDDDYD